MQTPKSNKHLHNIEARLRDKDRLIPFSDVFRKKVPNRAGIYAIWQFKRRHSPVYVGESSNLAERFRDLGYWRNHTFTRQVRKFCRRKQPKIVRKYIMNNYFISYLALSFGRKEAEEFLIHEWKTDEKVNKESPRYLNTLERK